MATVKTKLINRSSQVITVLRGIGGHLSVVTTLKVGSESQLHVDSDAEYTEYHFQVKGKAGEILLDLKTLSSDDAVEYRAVTFHDAAGDENVKWVGEPKAQTSSASTGTSGSQTAATGANKSKRDCAIL